MKWYTKAAQQGSANAQYRLGMMYYEGKGIPADYVEAYRWIVLAAMNDVPGTQDLIDTLRQKITPSQSEEARRRAKDLFREQQERSSTQSSQR
jgi:hypothetical protein